MQILFKKVESKLKNLTLKWIFETFWGALKVRVDDRTQRSTGKLFSFDQVAHHCTTVQLRSLVAPQNPKCSEKHPCFCPPAWQPSIASCVLSMPRPHGIALWRNGKELRFKKQFETKSLLESKKARLYFTWYCIYWERSCFSFISWLYHLTLRFAAERPFANLHQGPRASYRCDELPPSMPTWSRCFPCRNTKPPSRRLCPPD